MVERVMRTFNRTLEEIPYWTLAVRAGKFTPEGILFLAAHIRLSVTAVRGFQEALADRYQLGPYRSSYRYDCADMVNQPIENPQFVWPWVPDAISTVRAMSAVEHAAHQWRQDLARSSLTLAEALAMRRVIGQAAQGLEALAAFVECFDAAPAAAEPAAEPQY